MMNSLTPERLVGSYSFILSGENLDLAAAEAERLHGVAPLERRGNLLFLDVAAVTPGLAFTRSVSKVVAVAERENLDDALARTPWQELVQPPFCVRASGPGSETVDEAELASHVWRGLEAHGVKPGVDLEQPKTTITLTFTNLDAHVDGHPAAPLATVFIGLLAWRNDDKFSERRAHLRPRNHPTSLAPKLARAMINLAGPRAETENILDPFCGSGGLLLEGALAGRAMTGVDIDAEQVRRSEENLAAANVGAILAVGDARKCDLLGAFDAIVTDVPYGRNSKLEKPDEVFTEFFEAAARATDVMVVALPSGGFLPSLVRSNWRVVRSFTWRLHKSLEKLILVLERSGDAEF